MLGQLAELEYKAKRISDWRVARRGFAAISGLHPTARERHGREQRSAIELKLIFGYLNCRPGNIVVKYSTKGAAILYKVPKGGNCWKDPIFFINCSRQKIEVIIENVGRFLLKEEY